MARKEKMTEEELYSRIQGEIPIALGYMDTISKQRETAMDYYYGLPFGNEVEGRSQFVDSTVADTIEWIKPSLMRVFASGEEMVKFNPVGPEDVEMAKQATDYVNYVFTRDNPGWEILYSWFTDALLSKNGIVKVWWEEDDQWNREEYHRLSDTELEALTAKEEVEVLEHETYEEGDPDTGLIIYHDVVVSRHNSEGRIAIENVPPSEFLIHRESKTIQDSTFVCHRIQKSVSELREMGYEFDVEELGGGDEDMATYSSERLARYQFDKSAEYWEGWGNSDEYGDESLRVFWLHESYLRVDYDGDGIAELRRVCTVGQKVLANEEIDRIPFISLSPIKIPHKFFGLSVADLVMDLQLMKSTLMRNLMDNMYNQNFGRYAVLEGQANLDDLLTQRPGGIVRVKSPNAVMPLATPPLEPYSFQMLEYLDGVRESRAGVSKYSQGMNDKALTSHTTAAAVNQVMTAAQSRVELIARNFAETGVKELMRVIYELLVKNQDRERVVMLRNMWVPINPSSWKDKTDCIVSVALGNGNKDQQLAHLSTMMQFASQAMSGGLRIVNEQNLYNIGAAMVRNMGFQNVDDFMTDPSTIQPEQPQSSPEENIKAMEMEVKHKELEIKAGELQLKAQRLKQEAAEAEVNTQLKFAELQLEREQKRAVAIGAT